MININFTDLEKDEAHVHLHATDYFNALWELDMYLRDQTKHQDLSVDEWDTTQRIRDRLHELMEAHGVSLLDLQ